MDSSSESKINPPTIGIGDGIPFYSMGSTPFEKLSRDLIREEPGVKGSRKYGKTGQTDRGIDVYGELTNGQGLVIGQSKAYEEFTEKHLESVFNNFVKESAFWKGEKAKKFILFVGCEIERTQVADKERIIKSLFRDVGIEFEIWDSKEIERKIGKAKSCQHLVKIYLQPIAEIYVDRICYDDTSKPLERKDYKKPKNHIGRTVSESKISKKELFVLTDNLNKYDLADVLIEEKRILLLGDAGSGKTYELGRIAHKINGKESGYYPRVVSLKDYTDKDIVDYLDEDEQRNKESIVFLFDGLDEMPPEHRFRFIKKLNEYCKDENSLVLVSCRENLFEKGNGKSPQTLEGFQQFYLNELNNKQIRQYIDENISNREEFMSQAHELGIKSLLNNPFYLTNIVASFRESGSLPTSRSKVFDLIFVLRIKNDIDKIKSSGNGLQESNIYEIIEKANIKLALTLELLGKNICTQNELESILSGTALDLIKQFSSIINDEKEGISTWRFEHRQFQEFFTAQALKNLNFNELVEVTAFPPKYTVLKPSWYNTVGLLVSLIDKEEKLYSKLIDWLLENEIEVFLYLEKEKVPEEVANEVLNRFINIALERDVGIGLNLQELFKLSNLVFRESTKDLLIKHLDVEWENIKLNSDLVTIATEAKFYLPDKKNKILRIFKKKLFQENHPTYLKRRLIYAISKISTSDDLIESIVDHFKDTEEKSIRSALFYAIENKSLQSGYSDFLIENYEKFCAEGRGISSQLHSKTEKIDPISLSSVLSSVKDLNTFITLIDKFIDSPGNIDLLVSSFVEGFIDQAVYLYDKDREVILSKMIRLYAACCEKYALNEGKDLILFFEETNTKEEAFTQIIQDEQVRDSIILFNLLPVYTKSVEPVLIELVKKGEIELNSVRSFLNSGKGRYEISELRQKLHEATDEDFSIPDTPNWEEINSERRERDIQVIFYKKKFLDEIEKIFSTIQGNITPEKVRKLSFELETTRDFSEIVIFEVSKMLRDNLQKNEIIEKVKTWNWDNYRNLELYKRYVKGNKDPERLTELLGDNEIKIIKNWSLEKQEEVNFRGVLDTNEKGISSTPYKALFVWVFQRIFSFEYPDEKLLEMTSYDYLEFDNEGLEYYEKYFSSERILGAVFENLERGLKDRKVIKNHIDYATKKGVPEILNYTIQFISNDNFEISIRKYAVDSSLEFSDGVKPLLKYLQELNVDDVFWYTVDKIISLSKQLDQIRQILLKVLENEHSDAKLDAAVRLIILQDLEGLQYYVSTAEQDNKISSHRFIQSLRYSESPLSEFNNPEGIDQLLELLELQYHDDFAQSDHQNISNSIKIALKEIALQNEENFEEVVLKIKEFIQENKEEFSNVKYLFNFIDDISKQFYLNKSQEMDLSSATEKAEGIIQY